MSYPLRLPPNLDAAARERAAAIGISFNAFICVCVDAYLNGAKPAIEASAPRAASQSEKRRTRRDESEFQAVAEQAFDDNGQPIDDDEGHPDWQFFHPDPDFWPLVDPDPAWSKRRDAIQQKYGDAIETANEAIEREYWATRERPAREQPGRELAQAGRRGKRGG